MFEFVDGEGRTKCEGRAGRLPGSSFTLPDVDRPIISFRSFVSTWENQQWGFPVSLLAFVVI